MMVVGDPFIPDNFYRLCVEYYLVSFTIGKISAEKLYRKRISGMKGWICRKRSPSFSRYFIEKCIYVCFDDSKKLAKELHEQNPTYTSLSDFGFV